MSQSAVAISRQERYDVPEILACLREQFSALSLSPSLFQGKRVVLKPNLLLGYAPERCATTHPAVVEAAALLMKEFGAADILLAESPGGPYRKEILSSIYRSCGMTDAAERGVYRLNTDLSAQDVHYPSGTTSKMFHILTPLCDADIILNLCKLKTHALAQMTCGVKNLFGAIPGIEKVEMHARFREVPDFLSFLIDLYGAIESRCPIITVTDAIDGMEGNGPSGGTPKHAGLILTSSDAFALDAACEQIIDMQGQIPLNDLARKTAHIPAEICYPLLSPDQVIVTFAPATTNMKRKFDLIPNFMQPRPLINAKICVGCGKCMASCPAKAIDKKDGIAHIRKKDCIKCYCCQELCPLEAVDIYQHWLVRLLQPKKRKQK